jgi:hypothetical protein
MMKSGFRYSDILDMHEAEKDTWVSDILSLSADKETEGPKALTYQVEIDE